jgi:hypothetical protein
MTGPPLRPRQQVRRCGLPAVIRFRVAGVEEAGHDLLDSFVGADGAHARSLVIPGVYPPHRMIR